MYWRIWIASSDSAYFAPFCLEMAVISTKDSAAAEAVEPLVARESLMAGVVDKDQNVVALGLQFFICLRLHRKRLPYDRTESKCDAPGCCGLAQPADARHHSCRYPVGR